MVTKSINMVRTFKTFDCYVHSKLSRKLALGTMRKSVFYVEHITNLSSPHHQESTILAYNTQNRINKLFAADRLGKRTICQDLLAIFFLNSILPSSPPIFSLHNDLGGDGQWCQRHISCGSGRRQLA